ncbi:MAG TPA: hypothetical protein VM890_06520 [Longimicrobium sp.]|nr:hypothetical protein [Longimicrobium sp.]
MSRGIFLIGADERLVEMREQPYDSEDLLQRLLASYPSLLASDQIDPVNPRRWLLVSRETSVPGEQGGGGRWAVDHLFLDQDAIPTLVEVKRSTDTRLRREVVGQMLDYAANAVVYWPVEHLIEQFRGQCARQMTEPDQVLSEFLGGGADADAFWQQVKTNLQAGRVRMLFVADQIPPELRRVVEFLNQQMDPAEVLAVEIRQFTGGEGLRTLVPTVFGQTAAAQDRKGVPRPRGSWDEATFFEDLEKRGNTIGAVAARRLLEWAVSRRLRIWWGKGQLEGSFVPVLDLDAVSHQPFAVYSSGAVLIYFQWYAYKPPFSDERRRIEILHRLNEIPGVAIPESSISRRPSIPLTVLARDGNMARFLAVFDWFLEEVRSAAASPGNSAESEENRSS